MKLNIAKLVEQTLKSLPELSESSEIASIHTTVERTRDSRHGDFTTNIAMRLAKSVGRSPRDVAQMIVTAIPASELVDKVEIAGPGFINFHVSANAFHEEIAGLLSQGSEYGRQATRDEPKILLEFVSAKSDRPIACRPWSPRIFRRDAR